MDETPLVGEIKSVKLVISPEFKKKVIKGYPYDSRYNRIIKTFYEREELIAKLDA